MHKLDKQNLILQTWNKVSLCKILCWSQFPQGNLYLDTMHRSGGDSIQLSTSAPTFQSRRDTDWHHNGHFRPSLATMLSELDGQWPHGLAATCLTCGISLSDGWLDSYYLNHFYEQWTTNNPLTCMASLQVQNREFTTPPKSSWRKNSRFTRLVPSPSKARFVTRGYFADWELLNWFFYFVK